jgi:hypothetical protein
MPHLVGCGRRQVQSKYRKPVSALYTPEPVYVCPRIQAQSAMLIMVSLRFTWLGSGYFEIGGVVLPDQKSRDMEAAYRLAPPKAPIPRSRIRSASEPPPAEARQTVQDATA